MIQAVVERGTSLDTFDSPLLSLILPPGSPSNRSLAHDYLLSLTSRSLVDLRGQPAALSTAKSSLNNQLSSLCSQHVSSFEQVHKATSSLPSSLDNLDFALQSLIEQDLPALSNVAQQFSQHVEGSLQAKEKAHNLISQYDLMLKDLLDIPRLLMTCVRANHPVEALQLAVHMTKVVSQVKYSNVHKSLEEECCVHLKRLREDLLRALGARGLRLPAAKRLVNLLRKFKEIDDAGKAEVNTGERLSLSDSTVCLSFLRSRWTLIEELASTAATVKSTSILSLHLSTWRDIVGDTCALSQALFNNDATDELDELSPETLLFLFSHQSLSTLSRLLSEAIPNLREEATSLQENFDTLAAIHTQLAYSAASLARQGLEISRIVSGQSILHLEAVTLWKKALNDAKVSFEKRRLGKEASDCLSWIDGDKVQEVLNQDLQSFSTFEGWSARARQYPDVVAFINSLLQCYNALLSFAPQTTGEEVIDALDSILFQVLMPLFSTMERSKDKEFNLALPPILASDNRSRYFENDTTRQWEANLAVLARTMTVLIGGGMTYVRDLLLALYGIDHKEEASFSELKMRLMKWTQEAEVAWKKGEEHRRDRVRVEEEKLAAEERRQREEEQAQLAELERLKVEEARRRQEEEAERERQRQVEMKRAEEAEAERRRLAEVEEEKRLKNEAKREERRREDEEADREKQRRENEEEAKRKVEEEEEAERAKKSLEDIERIKKLEEEAEKARAAEEEAQRAVEAKESQKEEASDEAKSDNAVKNVMEELKKQESEEIEAAIPDDNKTGTAVREKANVVEASAIEVEGDAQALESVLEK